jgi:hypothetical protein
VAEAVAWRLAHAARITASPTPLTQSNRRQGRASNRSTTARSPTVRTLRLGTCKTCGAATSTAGRTHCDACLRAFRVEQQAGFAAAGPKALAELRRAGTDPAHGATAGQRRAETMRHHHTQAAQSCEPADPDLFDREILPTIQSVPLRGLAAATGLSLRYCALIRAGERTPHARHWLAFMAVGKASGASTDLPR